MQKDKSVTELFFNKRMTSTGLHNMLADFDKEGFQHECPHMYRPLLNALSTDQAVCGLLPASACDIVFDIAKGTSPHESPHTHRCRYVVRPSCKMHSIKMTCRR